MSKEADSVCKSLTPHPWEEYRNWLRKYLDLPSLEDILDGRPSKRKGTQCTE